ncbi:MAG: Ser-Thr-rich GPI-anchored membrane family protein [Acidobacteriota bacterium]
MKSLVTVVFTLILAASAGGQTVTVVAPNGGESWALGSVQNIRWVGGTEPGSESTVTLLLVQGTNTTVTIAEGLQVASQSFSWTVGQYLGGTAQPGSNYKVRVQYTSGAGADTSNGYFSIVSTPTATPTPTPTRTPTRTPTPPASASLRVTSPNGGESWRIGTERTISWTATGVTGKVRVELIRHPNYPSGTVGYAEAVDGHMTWKAGETTGGPIPAGQYRVRVKSELQPSVSDTSDQWFSLTSLQTHREVQRHALKPEVVSIPSVNKNWSNHDSFPGGLSVLPWDILQARTGCNSGVNQRAQVGRDWFDWNYVSVAELYRSQVVFNVSPHKPKAADMNTAKLRFKQADVKRINTTKVTALSAICELGAPWTTFTPSACGNWRHPNPSTEEFTVDVTDTVRKWLDGSLPNNGLLLWASEAPMSKKWTIISCYDVTLELEF